MGGCADYEDMDSQREEISSHIDEDALGDLVLPKVESDSGIRYQQLELFGNTSVLATFPGYLVTMTLDRQRELLTLKVENDPEWKGPAQDCLVDTDQIVDSVREYLRKKEFKARISISVEQ